MGFGVFRAPFRLAEVFGFGRANRTSLSDLALSSPDGESRRPVGKGECRVNPKGKLTGGVFSFGYFSLDKQRKVTRHSCAMYRMYKCRGGQGWPRAASGGRNNKTKAPKVRAKLSFPH